MFKAGLVLFQAYLSKVARETFVSTAKAFDVEWFEHLTVVASNDINEDTILSLNDQGHSIDVYGIGTHLGMPREVRSLPLKPKFVQPLILQIYANPSISLSPKLCIYLYFK